MDKSQRLDEIAHLKREGRSNRSIAKILEVDEGTIRYELRNSARNTHNGELAETEVISEFISAALHRHRQEPGKTFGDVIRELCGAMIDVDPNDPRIDVCQRHSAEIGRAVVAGW